jgi:hypothetical protein
MGLTVGYSEGILFYDNGFIVGFGGFEVAVAVKTFAVADYALVVFQGLGYLDILAFTEGAFHVWSPMISLSMFSANFLVAGSMYNL